MTVTPKDQLQQWFQYLQDFQVACEQVDTDVVYQDLLAFANSKISEDLSTNDEQQQFAIAAQHATSLTITQPDLAASSNFESLLETVWNPLNVFVASFMRSCASPPFSTMSFTDFVEQSLVKLFPGGATDPNWLQLQNGLTSSIPSACYSAGQQKAVVGLLSTPNKTAQSVIDLISKMG